MENPSPDHANASTASRRRVTVLLVGAAAITSTLGCQKKRPVNPDAVRFSAIGPDSVLVVTFDAQAIHQAPVIQAVFDGLDDATDAAGPRASMFAAELAGATEEAKRFADEVGLDDNDMGRTTYVFDYDGDQAHWFLPTVEQQFTKPVHLDRFVEAVTAMFEERMTASPVTESGVSRSRIVSLRREADDDRAGSGKVCVALGPDDATLFIGTAPSPTASH